MPLTAQQQKMKCCGVQLEFGVELQDYQDRILMYCQGHRPSEMKRRVILNILLSM